MKSMGILSAMSAMAIMSGNVSFKNDDYIGDDYRPLKEPPIPKGTQEYFFNANGEYSTSHMRRDECIFKCFAINDKNAIKKFHKSLGK